MIRFQRADEGVTRRVEPEGEMATERKQIVATPRWVARIDEWRRQQPGRIPTWSEAVRLLVDAGLDATSRSGETAMKTHVFEGKGNSYGFTQDSSGKNLPPEGAPWRAFKEIDLKPGEDRIGVKSDDVINGINKDGYYVTGVKITSEIKSA